MTVSAGSAKAGPYTGNDSASEFAFAFKVFASTDIRVVETTIATGVEADLVLDTGYSVALNEDQDNNPGGTVTYLAGALPSTKKLTVVGDFDYTQPTDIPNGGAFFAQTLENAFDRLTLLIKQVKERVDRAAVVDVSSSDNPDDILDGIGVAVIEAEAAQAAAETAQGLAEAAQAAAEAAQTTAEGIASGFAYVEKSADYTFVLGDAGKLYIHPSADTTARTWTLPANASVAFAIGTTISIRNQNSAGIITLAITSDTLRAVGSGSTGSRSVAPNGWVTLVKETATAWAVSGTGLS